MAIKISGTTVIDDDRNINVGIITANQFVGSGDNLIFSPTITTFNPTDGATGIALGTTISLTFDQPVYAGVGSIFLRDSSPDVGIGTEIEAIGIASTSQITFNNQTLTINPSSSLPSLTEIYVVIPKGVITNAVGGEAQLLDTYNFTTQDVPLGSAYEGGYLICASGGVRWIVAPSATQVGRNWYSRNDAVTTANASAACGDWFIPNCSQACNPLWTCRTYWDSFVPNYFYWSNTECNATLAFAKSSATSNAAQLVFKSYALCVRAFRCVTY